MKDCSSSFSLSLTLVLALVLAQGQYSVRVSVSVPPLLHCLMYIVYCHRTRSSDKACNLENLETKPCNQPNIMYIHFSKRLKYDISKIQKG